MFTILAIDNYPITLAGLHNFLESEFREASVIALDDVNKGRDYNKNLNPDVVILGNNTEDFRDSLLAVERCRAAFPSAALIIYDHCSSGRMVLSYLKLGVKGCILKANPAEEILKCIETVLEGKFYLTTSVMEKMINGTITQLIESKPKKQRSLSPRESEIASYLSDGNTTSWISNRLHLSSSTVSTIKKKIFEKMEVTNIIELQKIMGIDL